MTQDNDQPSTESAAERLGSSPACDLCEAARITPWYFENDLCWVAECEFCAVPMVVLRDHHPSPADAVQIELHNRLAAVVAEHFGFEHWVDDNMRNIPDHYHAHARRRGGVFGTASSFGRQS
ncbi:MAG: hypothetical protein ABIR32_23230 [Ilumatobacteraceae bacterium]